MGPGWPHTQPAPQEKVAGPNAELLSPEGTGPACPRTSRGGGPPFGNFARIPSSFSRCRRITHRQRIRRADNSVLQTPGPDA
jgi:hypothetical protein